MKALIGREVGPSEWREVTQELIDDFAELSGDHQWIHVDVERAKKESPFGTTIAHGNLTLSMVDGFRAGLIELERLRARRQLRLEQGPLPGPGPGRLEDPRLGRARSRSTRWAAAGGRPSTSSRSRSRATRSPSAWPNQSAVLWPRPTEPPPAT